MDSDGPGPFSLADPDRLRQLLDGAGFTDITVDPVAEPMYVGTGPADLLDFLADMSLVRDLVADVDPRTRTKVFDSLRDALEPHQRPDGIFLGAAAWLVTARHAVAGMARGALNDGVTAE